MDWRIQFNFQVDDHLITARYTGLVAFPAYETVERIDEFALLYGKRNIYGNVSFSYSGGISLVNREELVDYENGIARYDNQNHFGFPFELNVKWFQPKKERIMIYYFIPVGKPTAFGG